MEGVELGAPVAAQPDAARAARTGRPDDAGDGALALPPGALYGIGALGVVSLGALRELRGRPRRLRRTLGWRR